MKTTWVEIRAMGRSLPDVGDYVAGRDGQVYRVVELAHTYRADRVDGRVELADWDDVHAGNEPTAFALTYRDYEDYWAEGDENESNFSVL